MKLIKHIITITKHRHKVISHCFKAGIGFQGLFHDLSKYSITELKTGARYYVGYRSPNDMERRDKGYSEAWLHHQGRNRHHFEYWHDYNPNTGLVEPVEMPLKYVKEMFCDRIAASKIYLGKDYCESQPLEYFRRGKARDIAHPKTMDLLESWLMMLETEGEKKTFRYIKGLK